MSISSYFICQKRLYSTKKNLLLLPDMPFKLATLQQQVALTLASSRALSLLCIGLPGFITALWLISGHC